MSCCLCVSSGHDSTRPGKSCTSQLLNLTQHIEHGYQVGKITGTTFVDIPQNKNNPWLTEIYDGMNKLERKYKIIGIGKIYKYTQKFN